MSNDPQQIGQRVVEMSRELGFAHVGICAAQPSQYQSELHQWLDDGRHASMAWLEARANLRVDPRQVLSEAQSIVMVADVYAPRGASDHSPSSAAAVGRIARYARGDDYHEVMKRRLHQLCDSLRERFPKHEFRAFVDTAPILEREHAARAALGWVGKHTLLIHPETGSWMLLGGLLTTLDIQPPADQRAIDDHCGSCTRCIDACPTDAITPYSVDASRCISYLTIEHRGPIDTDLFAPMGDWIFGCDICQDVCPHNSMRPGGPEGAEGLVNPAYAQRRSGFDLLEVLGWTEDDRRDVFTRSAMKRATLPMMKRNALIAAGNRLAIQNDPDLHDRIVQITHDEREPDLVRSTAKQVLAGISAGRGV